MDYLTNLIIAISNGIAANDGKSNDTNTYTDVDKALEALAAAKIINSPDYWKTNYSKVTNVNYLILKAAQWLA
jgi:RAB protein geranylgeranyltransferase component A